jgi:hypothetical protein
MSLEPSADLVDLLMRLDAGLSHDLCVAQAR